MNAYFISGIGADRRIFKYILLPQAFPPILSIGSRTIKTKPLPTMPPGALPRSMRSNPLPWRILNLKYSETANRSSLNTPFVWNKMSDKQPILGWLNNILYFALKPATMSSGSSRIPRSKKIIATIPFLIVAILGIFTWITFATTEYAATWRQYVGLFMIIANGVLYYFRFKAALLLTGIVLVLATFGLVSFFSVISVWGITLFGVSTPGINGWSLLLLLAYCVVNFNMLVGWYWDMKGIKARN
jgi:hypothetical protein